MAGFVDLKCDVIKGGMKLNNIINPIFQPGHYGPFYQDYIIFEGISVDKNGKQHYMDSNLAYKNACRNAIAYLEK